MTRAEIWVTFGSSGDLWVLWTVRVYLWGCLWGKDGISGKGGISAESAGTGEFENSFIGRATSGEGNRVTPQQRVSATLLALPSLSPSRYSLQLGSLSSIIVSSSVSVVSYSR